MSTQEIINRYKYWLYGFILWLMPNIAFLIVGGNGRRFFPFGLSFFNLSDYGLLEFFVYAIAIPITIFIIYDVLLHSNKAMAIACDIGLSLLYLFDIFMLFVTIRSVTIGFFGLFNADLLYAYNHNWSIWEILFDFSGKPQKVLTISGIASTILMASLILKNFIQGEKDGLLWTGFRCCCFLVLSWFGWFLGEKFDYWGLLIYLGCFILFAVLISIITKNRNTVRPGMTKELCIKKWGDAKEERIVRKGEDELDCLEYPKHDLYFKNDILFRIENRTIYGVFHVNEHNTVFFIDFEQDNTFSAHISDMTERSITGTYSISFGEIYLLADTDLVFKKHGIIWDFGGKEVRSKIDGSSFTIQAQRTSRGITKTYDLTFRR